MTYQTSAGTTIGIVASAPATFNAAGYGALSFVPIGEVLDIGEYGRVYELITSKPLASRGTTKKKGGYDEGGMPLQLNRDKSDAGQLLAVAAVDSDAYYSFCITFQNGDKHYFQALVMSYKTAIGGTDKNTGASINLEITTSSTGVGIVEDLA